MMKTDCADVSRPPIDVGPAIVRQGTAIRRLASVGTVTPADDQQKLV